MNTEHKTTLAHRLKIIAGQIEGLIKMVETDKYCIDVLIQSLAVQKALQNVDKMILEDHISSCIVDQMKTGDEVKAIDELTKIYSLYRKS